MSKNGSGDCCCRIALVGDPVDLAELARLDERQLSEHHDFVEDPDSTDKVRGRITQAKARAIWEDGGRTVRAVVGSCRLNGSEASAVFFPSTGHAYFFVPTVPLC